MFSDEKAKNFPAANTFGLFSILQYRGLKEVESVTTHSHIQYMYVFLQKIGRLCLSRITHHISFMDCQCETSSTTWRTQWLMPAQHLLPLPPVLSLLPLKIMYILRS